MMLQMNCLVVLATFAALGPTLAAADPTASPNEPTTEPTTGPTSEPTASMGGPRRAAFYGEVSAWYGRLGFPRPYRGGPDRATIKDLRWSFGLTVTRADGWALRIGPVPRQLGGWWSACSR